MLLWDLRLFYKSQQLLCRLLVLLKVINIPLLFMATVNFADLLQQNAGEFANIKLEMHIF